jgi:hypothetical protein
MASAQTAPKTTDKPAAEAQPVAEQKPAALEEDDEFEDFPVDGASRPSFPTTPVPTYNHYSQQ